MYLDLVHAYALRRRLFLMSGTALVVGLASFGYRPLSLAFSLAGAALSALLLTRDLRELRRADHRFVLTPTSPPLDRLRPATAYTDGEIVAVPSGTALCSNSTDDLLVGAPIPFRCSSDPYQVPPELAFAEPFALRWHRRDGRLIFNSALVRLDDDPVPQQIARRPVNIRAASYYSALSTTYLSGMAICDRRSGEVVLGELELISDATGTIYDLTASRLANIVGVSTLAVTRDRQLVLQVQGRDNVSSPGLLAPSGSGSLDFADAKRDPTPDSLQDLLVRGMERELCEETGLPAARMSTRVIGFARWLDKGAKPEFFGVTALDLDQDDVRRTRIPRAERTLTEMIETVPLDVGALLTKRIERAEDILPPHHRHAAAVPLTLALRAFHRRLRLDPSFLDHLFR